MIERMKKLTLLIYHSSKNLFLNRLQEFGIVHLETGLPSQTEPIHQLNQEIARLKKAEKTIRSAAAELDIKMKNESYPGNIEALLNELEKEKAQLDTDLSLLDNLKKERDSLLPWGQFDPDIISQLSSAGIHLKFFSLPKSKFEKKIIPLELPLEIICQMKGIIYFTVFYQNENEINALEATEEKPSLKNLDKLNTEILGLHTVILDQKNRIAYYLRYIQIIIDQINLCEDRLSYYLAETNLSPEVEGKILIIKGWFPKRHLKKLKNFLQSEDVAYFIDDPTPQDNVPILLRNNPIARLFEPIGKMLNLPTYMEVDPTPFFAPFFTAFFGMCSADLGYGAILFTVAFLVFLLVKSNGIRPIAVLIMILSTFSMIGGVIFGAFFGAINQYSIITPPEIINQYTIFSSNDSIMLLAMMLGIIQMLFGLLLQMVNAIRKDGFQGLLKPLGVFAVIIGGVIYAVVKMGKNFMIGPLEIGKLIFKLSDPNLTSFIAIFSGLFLVLFFNNLDKKIYLRPLFGLWEIYQMVTGIPSDILSYLRLFALGLASGLLGSAVNQIAGMVRGEGSIGGLIGMIIVLIIGHSLNFGLGLMGSFVHPLRLTFVEFYKAVGYTGGGLAYTPFKYKSKRSF